MIEYKKPTFDEAVNSILFLSGFCLVLISNSNLLLAFGIILIALHTDFSLGEISIKFQTKKDI